MIYSTIDDYIDQQVAPALADLDEAPTRDQLLTIAHKMTTWHDEYTPAGDIDLDRTGYIEDPERDFWDTAWDTLYGIENADED